MKELRRLVKGAPYLREIPSANRGSDGLPFGRGAVDGRELPLQKPRHFHIPTIPGHLEDVAERQWLRAVLEQKVGNRDLVLANGEREWRPVLVVGADERRIPRHELFYGFEDARDAGA